MLREPHPVDGVVFSEFSLVERWRGLMNDSMISHNIQTLIGLGMT